MKSTRQRRVWAGLLVAAGLLAHGCRSQQDDQGGSATGNMQGNTGLENHNRDFSKSESNKGSVNAEAPSSGVAGETQRQGMGESGSAATVQLPENEGVGGSGLGRPLSGGNEELLGSGTLPSDSTHPSHPEADQIQPQHRAKELEQALKALREQQQGGQQ